VRGRPRLVGVGVGPGAPDLLTLRAVRAIQAADVVFAPVRRAGERSLSLEIVAAHLDRSRQEIVSVPFPSTRGRDRWREVAASLADHLEPDRCGVFLTEGDPLLFGTFGHVVAALRLLRPDLCVETVPGISSVTAAAGAAGVPLVDGDERLAIVPASAADLAQILSRFECTVLLKVGPVIRETLALLDRLGLLDGAVYVRRCGQPGQTIVPDVRTLLAAPPDDYFALLIVHRR
jgi:precorrin-2/cobalt-factor-2 C20-methyltransferase